MLNVRVVIWDEIPHEDWVGILQVIPFGEYISDLPYNVPNNQRKIRVPLYSLSEYLRYAQSEYAEMPCLEFEKVRAKTPNGLVSYIWRRLR